MLKWHGVAAATTIDNSRLFYVSDAPGPGDELVPALTVPPNYPIVSARSATNFTVNLETNPAGVPLVFDLILNGNQSVPLASVTLSAPGIGVVPGPFLIPANARIDVAFKAGTATPTSSGVTFSATLEL